MIVVDEKIKEAELERLRLENDILRMKIARYKLRSEIVHDGGVDSDGEYHLLCILIDGAYANTVINMSICKWLLKHNDRVVVLLKSWEISRDEYFEFQKDYESVMAGLEGDYGGS